jgi:chromate transporter
LTGESTTIGGSLPAALSTPLLEIAAFFLRLGATAFGGPAAHIAIMREELVKKRAWMTEERFLDLVGAANLIPGPSSTEVAIFIGHARAGWPGLVVAGASFILPAALITAAIASAYVRFGGLPETRGILYGLKPVIIAVVVQALVGLARAALKTKALFALALVSAIAADLGADGLLVITLAGAIAAAARRLETAPGAPLAFPLFGSTAKTSSVGAAILAGTGTGATAFSGAMLFLVFLKVGAVLFGSGYVLLAFLRTDLVERLGWLTEAQLLDAIAVGQITPGPVFTTATFIGYVLDGVPGAALATLGIFLPGFVLVAIAGSILPRVRRSATAGAFLDGVNAGSLALMAVVAIQLGRSALVDPWTAGIALVSAAALVFFRVSSLWLLAGGAALGVLRTLT